MKKKLVSLLLAVCMLASTALIFAGCTSGNKSQVNENDPKAQTLVLSILKDERTTDAALAAVQNALNEITENEYNTHIILKAYTEEEYADNILAQSEALAAQQREFEKKYVDRFGNLSEEVQGEKRVYDFDSNIQYEQVANKDWVYYDAEYNKPVTVYPTVNENQLDVIFINNLDLYYQLVRNQYVIAIDNDFTDDLSLQKNFDMKVNAVLCRRLRAVGDGENVPEGYLYAIPNNYYAPGETYVVINKKLYDHYGYSIDCNIYGETRAFADEFADFIDYLYDVAQGNEQMKTENEELYVDKVLYNFEDLEWISCFNGDDGRKSALMTNAGISVNEDTVNNPTSIYKNDNYSRAMNLVYELRSTYGCEPHIGPCFYRATAESNGYAAPAPKYEDNEETFALAVVTGDKSMKQYYNSEDYYVVNITRPIVGNEMFTSMFAVSTFSSTALGSDGMTLRTNIYDYEDQTNPRCMQIIYALQSDKEIVNLLTYGIRDYNYDIYENENSNLVHNAGKNGYFPIVGKAGNLFLTYPNDKMSEEELYLSENEWSACYGQLLLVSPFCGLRLSNEPEAYNGVSYSAQQAQLFFQEFYDKYSEKILHFEGKDDEGKECTLNEYLDQIHKELLASDLYKYYKDANYQKGFEYAPKVTNYAFFLLVYRQSSLDDLIISDDDEE